eukprot:2087688-Rhodomonas_salina.2
MSGTDIVAYGAARANSSPRAADRCFLSLTLEQPRLCNKYLANTRQTPPTYTPNIPRKRTECPPHTSRTCAQHRPKTRHVPRIGHWRDDWRAMWCGQPVQSGTVDASKIRSVGVNLSYLDMHGQLARWSAAMARLLSGVVRRWVVRGIRWLSLSLCLLQVLLHAGFYCTHRSSAHFLTSGKSNPHFGPGDDSKSWPFEFKLVEIAAV